MTILLVIMIVLTLPNLQYNRQENFRHVIETIQGRQNVEIPQEVYDGLEKHLATPMTGGARDRISKKDIRTTLTKLGMAKYYGDVHLIHYEFTGLPPHDIREREDDLLYDIKILMRRFTGRNFFNTQYVLYKLLQRHGYQCDESEFFIPKSIKEEAFKELLDRRLLPPSSRHRLDGRE